MASIATLYAEVLPETSKIAAGITAAFRKVDPEAREAGRRWGREIQQGLGEAKVELKADTAKAKAEIDEAAKDKTATVEVNADTAKAEAQIDVAARDRKATIEVDADTLVASAERGFSQMAPAMAGAGTQLATSLSSSGASAASNVGGSLSGAMGPVGSALTVALVGGAVVAAAGVAAALSGAIGLIPAGLGGGVAVLGTLVTGLDGVKDAWDAAGKAADSANKDGAEKAKAVASAQKTLRDAVMDEVTAQKDVANARKDARQQLEDLNVELRGGVIDEKSAILDAQAARRDLATGRFKDSIEYQQAQLRVQQADQRVLEAHERNVTLQNKATDANAKGVNQSDQVVAANQRLAKAHDDVATAQQNLAATQNKPSSTAEALATAMGKLSPVAQGFIQTLEGLKPAWNQLKFAVQDSLFAGLGPQIQALATQYLPVLKTAMTGLAGTMNSAFKDVGAWLSKPETMATIQQIVANIGSSFQVWSQSLVPFSNAFLTITQVGSGFLPSLGKVITDGANAFNNFIQSAARSGELQQWMRTGIEAMAQLMKMLPILGKMFLDLAPMAIPFLQMMNSLLPMVEPVFRVLGIVAERFFTGFNKFLNSAKGWIGEFVGVIKQLGEVFGRVWGAISGAIDKAWKIIKPILDEFKKALSLLNPGDILGKIGRFFGGDDKTVSGAPTATTSAAPPAAPSATPPVMPTGGWFGGGGKAVRAFGSGTGPLGDALAAQGFSPHLIRLIQGFSQVEGNNPAGNPTLGFTDSQLGGASDLQSHVAALAKQIKDRSTVAGPFPEGGTDQQQAEWIAKVVGQSGLSSDWQGNAQPQNYVGRVLGAMGSAPSSMPSASAGAAAPSAAMPSIPSTGASGGGSYGLPAGTNTGGYGSGGGAFPQWLIDLGAQYGVTPSTYPGHQESDRNEPGYAPNPQHQNRGVDWVGSRENMERFAQALTAFGGAEGSGGGLEQVIYQAGPGGTKYGLGGAGNVAPGYYPQGTYDEHGGTDNGAHVHTRFSSDPFSGMYPSAAGMPTIASPQGVSPSGVPLGTQQSPMYVQNAQGPSGQQLGQDFVSGIGEMFGLDGSLFKNPMDTGLFKGFKGAMGFFSGLMGGGKGGQGLPASAWAAQGGDGAALPAMGGGDMLSGLGGMLTGIMPQPFGQTTRGGPMQAPDEYQPMLPGSGGVTGMPSNFLAPGQGETPTGGHKFDQSINFYGPVGNPQAAGDMATGLNVPRARQGLTGLPK